MDIGQVSAILREGIFVALKIGGPLLILSMLIGVLIAIFQAVTQIHEQTLAFAIKLSVIVLVFMIFGGRMLDMLLDYSNSLFALMRGS